jgi:hypothetical protein
MVLNRISIFRTFVVSIALFAGSAMADCATTCSDTDGGVEPAIAGSVDILSRCSENGSNSAEETESYPDQCISARALIEYSCNASVPGAETVTATRVKCATDCVSTEAGAACEKEKPSTCATPVCVPPAEGCHYGPPTMRDGCAVDCGALICTAPSPTPNDGNGNGNGKPGKPGKGGKGGKG